MEIRSTEEARENIEKFTKAYINLLKEKKKIDADIKQLKNDYKEDGVAVQIVCKVFNKLKSNKKKTASQLFEEECIETWLSENADIDNEIGILNSKD